MAVAVFGLAAVACDDQSAEGGGATTAPSTTLPPEATTASTTTTETPTTTTTSLAPETGVWERISLGFVSAYVLARAGSAAVVDTGVSGSEDDIEAGLGALGAGWDSVGHVILTHHHGDHVGSIEAVLERAAAAAAYAGEADIPRISSTRPLTPVGDGDEVFGLEIIATPGHTPGHVSVLDPAAGVLVAGDALNGGDTMGGRAGTVAGPNPQFSSDMPTANETVKKLAALQFDTILFGHGEPVEGGAAALLAELAAGL